MNIVYTVMWINHAGTHVRSFDQARDGVAAEVLANRCYDQTTAFVKVISMHEPGNYTAIMNCQPFKLS